MLAAAAAGLVLRKPKTTMSAVQGKIVVNAEDGEKIGMWGGNECFLSRETGVGPCLVVRTASMKRGQGTFFRLAGLRQVLGHHASQGKLTLILPHQTRVCHVFIQTTDDIKELVMMCNILRDNKRWGELEVDVSQTVGRAAAKDKMNKKEQAAALKQAQGRGDAYDHEVDAEENENEGGDDEGERIAVDFTTPSNQAHGLNAESHAAVDKTEEEAADSPAARAPVMNRPGTAAAAVGDGLSPMQRRALQFVYQGRNVFVCGPAGSGKTFWLQHLIRLLSESEGVAVTAATGVAARLINGTTVHSFAGLGRQELSLDEHLARIQRRPEVVRSWQTTRILVVDEIGMIGAATLTLLDGIARSLRRAHKDAPFGGIQLVLVGDFLQLPPIVKSNASSNDATFPYAFTSPAWAAAKLASVQLDFNYRHKDDVNFAMCCLDVREGIFSPLVAEVMHECLNRELPRRNGVEPTIIVPLRQQADAINESKLMELELADFQRYVADDSKISDAIDLDAEVSLLPLVTLKVGAQVVLLQTTEFQTREGSVRLPNGELGVVTGFAEQQYGPALPVVMFASASEECVVHRCKADVHGRGTNSVVATRLQLPLALAWALTVHRVQGMTLPMARITLDKSVFETGQAYVALSRVRRAKDLCVTAFAPEAIKASPQCVAFFASLFPPSPADVARRAQNRQVTAEKEVKAAPAASRDEQPLKKARLDLPTKEAKASGLAVSARDTSAESEAAKKTVADAAVMEAPRAESAPAQAPAPAPTRTWLIDDE